MDQERLLRVLWDDFNRYRLQTGYIHKLRGEGAYITTLKFNGARKALMEQLVAWCAERKVDPRLWLRSLFIARKWMYAPKLNQFMSDKNLPRYHTLPQSELAEFQKMIQSEWDSDRVLRGTAYSASRDLTPSTEGVKRLYVSRGEPDRCLQQMETETLGFHPLSEVCKGCPISEKCKTQLMALAHFDIIAFREGKLTPEQAREQEVAFYYGAR